MTAVILDLDNTLYNWIDAIMPAYKAMIEEVARKLNSDPETIKSQLSQVNQSLGTIERPFSIFEISQIKSRYGSSDLSTLRNEFASALHAFSEIRKRNLRLYDGVLSSLDTMRARGIKIIGYTDTNIYGVIDRVARLSLDGRLHVVYCAEVDRHEFSVSDIYDKSFFDRLRSTQLRELSSGYRKPNELGLSHIMTEENLDSGTTYVVGDSLRRDIAPAQKLGLSTVLAKYGQEHLTENMQLLISISHWCDDQIAAENLASTDRASVPDYTISNFSQLLEIIPVSQQLTN